MSRCPTRAVSLGRLPLWPEVGAGLFLGGVYLMVTGDAPYPTLRVTRTMHPQPGLVWPWLYLTLFAASLAVLAARGRLRFGRRTGSDFLIPSVALLTGSFLLSVIFSQVRPLSVFAFGCFLAIVGFGCAVAQILEEETAPAEVSIVIAVAAAVLALRVIAWRLDEGFGVQAFHLRNTAWLGKLQLAWVLNLTAPLLLARFMEERTVVGSALQGSAWLLSGAAIYLLFSRMGSVVFALTTVILCAVNPGYWRRWVTLLVVVTSLALPLVRSTGAMSTYVVTSLITLQDQGAVPRPAIWRETARMILDRPVTGIGLGTYDDVAYSQYRTAGNPGFRRNGWHAHNVFLHVLAETGLIGFLAWCYLWSTIVRFLLRRWRDGDTLGRLDSTAALCVLLAFFALSLTEDLVAARVHASLRMNLTCGLLVIYGIRLASRTRSAPPVPCSAGRLGRPPMAH